MKTCHLFAGIGGGLLADRILGHDPIIAVEWDRYACQVLRERAADGWFPNLRVWEGDVRLFDPSEYANRVDCIHAGFPCQDISVAGNQAGLGEGTRSGLYREVLRIAGIIKPRQIFLENVSAILSNGLGTVLADLAAMGYDTRWICLRASEVGAPHHRDRWWCLAYSASAQNNLQRGTGEFRRIGMDGNGETAQQDNGQTSYNSFNGCREGSRNVRNTEHAGRNAAEVTGSSTQGSDGNEARAEQASEPTRPSDAEVLAYAGHAGICQRGFVGDAGEQMQHESGIFGDGLSRSSEQEGEVLAYANDKRQLQQKRTFDNQWRRIGDSSEFESDEDVADTECIRQSGQGKHERPKHSAPDSDRQADRLINGSEGNADWWHVESLVGRVANGIPNRVDKLKGLGNAQVPLQASVAWKLLGGE